MRALLPPMKYLSLVGPMHPGDDLDERRLSRPVVAEDGQGLPGAEPEAHVVHGGQAAEALRYVLGLEYVVHHAFSCI